MRISRALLMITGALLITAGGCTKQIAVTAESDPKKPPLSVSKDGYGIVAGFDNAPKKIEIYTEPQCNHCADLQHDFGDQLAYYIGVGQLEVTYRPMTFLDDKTGGYSGQVSNALFLATEKTGSPEAKATGTEFQRFVEDLWAHQHPGGTPPTGDEFKAMDDANFEFLYEIDSTEMGTPTVYDLDKGEKLDIYDNDWLNKLIQS